MRRITPLCLLFALSSPALAAQDCDINGTQEETIEFNDRGQIKELRCAEQALLPKEVDDGRYCGHGATSPRTHELFSDKGVLRGRLSLHDGRTRTSEMPALAPIRCQSALQLLETGELLRLGKMMASQ